MATLDSIVGIEALVRRKVVEERKTHQQISDELKEVYPRMKGHSSRSVRRFCDKHNIHVTSRLTDDQLDRVVAASVSKVYMLIGIVHI